MIGGVFVAYWGPAMLSNAGGRFSAMRSRKLTQQVIQKSHSDDEYFGNLFFGHGHQIFGLEGS